MGGQVLWGKAKNAVGELPCAAPAGNNGDLAPGRSAPPSRGHQDISEETMRYESVQQRAKVLWESKVGGKQNKLLVSKNPL